MGVGLKDRGGWKDAERDALRFNDLAGIVPDSRTKVLIEALEWHALQWNSPVAKTALKQFRGHKELEE